MKIAIKCVNKGKCFPNRLSKRLLSTLARELLEGCSWWKGAPGGGSNHSQSPAFPEVREWGREGQDCSSELQS